MDLAEKIETGKFKALLIEDDILYANVLARRLSSYDHPSFHVACVSRLQQGLDTLAKGGIDVVLLDLMLPGSKGIETLVKVQAQAPEVPVVVLTGLDDPSLGIDAVRKGAQDYCVKGRADGNMLAHVLRYAIERNQLQASLRNLSLTDELTGLHNRRGFLTLAEQQLKLFRRTREELLLVFVDLDKLKQINDTFGHQEGDQALIDIAQILKATFRVSDIIARIGGDEFAALVIDACHDYGAVVLTHLDRRLKFHNAQEDRKVKLSISSGLAYFDPASPRHLQELMAQADEAMYRHKLTKKTASIAEAPQFPQERSQTKDEVWKKAAVAGGNGKKKILIVEDDQAIQKFLGYRLRKLGFDVIAARDGKQGLGEAIGQAPNLIILDLMLPKFSGEEVCKAIREDEDEAFANIPIIMLTAKTSDVDRIIGKVIGANSYLTKPFSAKELLSEVNRLINA